MTIQSSTVRVIYNGNNSTVVYYPVTFVYAVSTEVHVLVTDANSVNTELTFGTDYTVDPSGVLTTAAWDDTHTVTVYRVTDTVQLTDYVENDKFPADTHEDALDKLTRICQEIRETLTRTLQVSVNAPLSGPVPAATTRFLFIDDAGQFAAITPVEALAELNTAAGIGANYTAVFADAAARAAATPLFIGQIGVQLDATGLNGFYRGTSLSAGGWAQVFLGPTDIQGLTSARLLGRYSSGSGNSEQIEIGTGLNLVAGILSASASAPLATEITGVTTDSLIGRDTAGTGNAELLGIGTGLELVSGILKAGALVKFQVLTASNPTYAYEANANYAILLGVAGGGAGGGAGATTGVQVSMGSGGWSGSWGIHIVDLSALTIRQGSFTIGAAGTPASGASGGAGGDSGYTDDTPSTLSLPGGSGGFTLGAGAFFASFTRESAPTATSGFNVIARRATQGTLAVRHTTNNGSSPMSANGGGGGSSPFGDGGYVPNEYNKSGAFNDSGKSGGGYGSGGSGGISGGGGGAVSGGTGTQGLWIVIQIK